MIPSIVGRQARSRTLSAVARCVWLATLPATVPVMRRVEGISRGEKGEYRLKPVGCFSHRILLPSCEQAALRSTKVRKGWAGGQHRHAHWSRSVAARKMTSTDHACSLLTMTHRASSIDGSRAVHLSKKRQLRMIFASVDTAAECDLAAASSETFLSPSFSRPPLPPSSFWLIRSSMYLSSSSESASPASASRTSAAAAATSFSARGGELARSSLHLRVPAEGEVPGNYPEYFPGLMNVLIHLLRACLSETQGIRCTFPHGLRDQNRDSHHRKKTRAFPKLKSYFQARFAP